MKTIIEWLEAKVLDFEKELLVAEARHKKWSDAYLQCREKGPEVLTIGTLRQYKDWKALQLKGK